MSVIPKKIYIRHFGTVQESELVLPGPGLCLVIGRNSTSSSVESIGSGKTLLGEAISRTLLGVSGRFSNFGAYSSDLCGNKNTLIKLDCDLNGKPLTIWSGYRCKELSSTGEGLRFQYGSDDPIERGKLTETRAELSKLIGIPPTLAEHTIHVDGERLKFNHLSERDLVDLFLSVTSIGSWEAAQKRVSASISSTREEKAGIEAKKQLIEESISTFQRKIDQTNEALSQEIERVRSRKEEQDVLIAQEESKVNVFRQKIKTIEKEKISIKSQIKKLEEEKAKSYAQLELKLKRSTSEIASISVEVEAAVKEEAAANSSYEAAKRDLDSLAEPDFCPTCKKPWDKKHSDSALKERRTRLEEAEKVLKEKRDLSRKIKNKRQEARDAQTDIQTSMRQLNAGRHIQTLSEEFEDLENQEDSVNEGIKRAEKKIAELRLPVDESRIAVLRAQAASYAAEKKNAEDSISSYDQKIVEVGAFLQVLEYLYRAFGPTGLPNMLLNDSLQYLNRASSHLSSVLTGGLIEISFNSTKQLAAGDSKPSLTINAKNRTGSKRFNGASKGEAGISNLIIAEVLYSLGRLWQKVGYRWLDEAVNSQDPTVRGSVYSYFREQASKQNLLTFAVDHSHDVEAQANHIVIAEKSSAGFTTYRVL